MVGAAGPAWRPRNAVFRAAEATEKTVERRTRPERQPVLVSATRPRAVVEFHPHRNHRRLHLLDDVGKANRARWAVASMRWRRDARHVAGWPESWTEHQRSTAQSSHRGKQTRPPQTSGRGSSCSILVCAIEHRLPLRPKPVPPHPRAEPCRPEPYGGLTAGLNNRKVNR